jgi:hypothetical protein
MSPKRKIQLYAVCINTMQHHTKFSFFGLNFVQILYIISNFLLTFYLILKFPLML